MAPLISCRLDRTNLVLCLAGGLFIAYHGLTTNEIMGYHARFYAPAMPVFVLATLRGLQGADSALKKRLVVVFGMAAACLVGAAFEQRWMETAIGRTSYGHQYAVYVAGVLLVEALLLFPVRMQKLGSVAAALGLATFQFLSTTPPRLEVESDAQSDFGVYSTNSGQVGIEVVKSCFAEPLELMHSELGIPGVLFPESRILDYTGLANPDVAKRTFDFEEVCRTERPGFIFRPHGTHRRLTRKFDASRCLAKNYKRVPLRRRSGCPLFVRNDLVAQYRSCGK